MSYRDVSLHGWTKKLSQGYGIYLGAVAACALLLSPLAASAAGSVTQIGFVKILAQATGAVSDLSGSDADFLDWASSNGINVDDPSAVVTKNDAARTIAQLLKLNPKKYNGNIIRNLQREGIEIPEEITRESLVDLLGGRLGPRLPDTVKSNSPVRRGQTGGRPPGLSKSPKWRDTPTDELPGAQGIANAQNRGNKR